MIMDGIYFVSLEIFGLFQKLNLSNNLNLNLQNHYVYLISYLYKQALILRIKSAAFSAQGGSYTSPKILPDCLTPKFNLLIFFRNVGK